MIGIDVHLTAYGADYDWKVKLPMCLDCDAEAINHIQRPFVA
jgi:hypothetical protein